MRIAFSGTHRVGKTTLLHAVAEILSDHPTVDEPYHLLEEEGHELCGEPSEEDFEAQLERSLAALHEAEGDVLLDRCPADLLAYLLVHDDAAAFELDGWIDRVRDAMRTLDLVVFVPIEDQDRIALPGHEDAVHRQAVHEELHRLLVDDPLGFETDVLTVHGDVDARVARVLARVGRAAGRTS